jgi:SAM-dependent methyltransferase
MTSADRHYTGAAGREYHEKKHVLPPAAVNWISKLRAEKIQAYVQPTDTVFEFGAGYGWNLLSLRCARRIAFDISEHAGSSDSMIEWVRDTDALPEQSANIVICHHALEHVIRPAESLEKMRRLLRPGGRLLLYVPFEKERRYRRFNPTEPNHHLYSWNVQTLGNLVTECQFQVESAEVGEFGYDRFAANLATKLKAGESGFRVIRRIAHLLKPASEVRVIARRT